MTSMQVVVLVCFSLATTHAKRIRVLDNTQQVLEKEAAQMDRLPVVDDNPIGLGTIPGSYGLLVRIFGSEKDGLKVEDLETIVLERRFPRKYKFKGKLEDRPDNRGNQLNVLALNNTDDIRDNADPFASRRRRRRRRRLRDDEIRPAFVEFGLENVMFIICPFLSTLVNEGALPLKQLYTDHELEEVTIRAGLDKKIAKAHVEDNFENTPSGIQDIWNLEGATNEHKQSTGINDCSTRFSHCADEKEASSCEVRTERSCFLPNEKNFDRFIRTVTRGKGKKDERITLEALNEAASNSKVDI